MYEGVYSEHVHECTCSTCGAHYTLYMYTVHCVYNMLALEASLLTFFPDLWCTLWVNYQCGGLAVIIHVHVHCTPSCVCVCVYSTACTCTCVQCICNWSCRHAMLLQPTGDQLHVHVQVYYPVVACCCSMLPVYV